MSHLIGASKFKNEASIYSKKQVEVTRATLERVLRASGKNPASIGQLTVDELLQATKLMPINTESDYYMALRLTALAQDAIENGYQIYYY